jgi:hypothetical protein
MSGAMVGVGGISQRLGEGRCGVRSRPSGPRCMGVGGGFELPRMTGGCVSQSADSREEGGADERKDGATGELDTLFKTP